MSAADTEADTAASVASVVSASFASFARRRLASLIPGFAAYLPRASLLEGSEAPLAFPSSMSWPAAGWWPGTRRAPTPRFGGGDVYFDDNAWLGLVLVRHHQLSGEERSLVLARRVLGFVLSGWSERSDWWCPGGLRWRVDEGNRSRHCCSSAPAAQLAALVHQETGDEGALAWAERIHDWTVRALRRPDGLYADRVDPSGHVVDDVWSYNQGAMIGAGLLLHRLTGRPHYLESVRLTAGASLALYTGEGAATELDRQGPAFNAILFRNLLQLPAERPVEERDRARVRASFAGWADRLWARWSSEGGFGGDEPSFLRGTAVLQLESLVAGAPAHP